MAQHSFEHIALNAKLTRSACSRKFNFLCNIVLRCKVQRKRIFHSAVLSSYLRYLTLPYRRQSLCFGRSEIFRKTETRGQRVNYLSTVVSFHVLLHYILYINDLRL